MNEGCWQHRYSCGHTYIGKHYITTDLQGDSRNDEYLRGNYMTYTDKLGENYRSMVSHSVKETRAVSVLA